MNAEITKLEGEKKQLEATNVTQLDLKNDKVKLEMRMAELEEGKEVVERHRLELEADIERLNLKLEYEQQPNIAFEKENELLQSQVCW